MYNNIQGVPPPYEPDKLRKYNGISINWALICLESLDPNSEKIQELYTEADNKCINDIAFGAYFNICFQWFKYIHF